MNDSRWCLSDMSPSSTYLMAGWRHERPRHTAVASRVPGARAGRTSRDPRHLLAIGHSECAHGTLYYWRSQTYRTGVVAQLMASMIEGREATVSILDAGAGVGSLFAACAAELCRRQPPPRRIHVTAYEIDADLVVYLNDTLTLCREMSARVGVDFSGEVRQADFIESAVGLLRGDLFSPSAPLHPNCVILNPPYAKIHSQSRHRHWLRQLGIETGIGLTQLTRGCSADAPSTAGWPHE